MIPENCLLKGAVTELIATFDKDEKLNLTMYADQCQFQLDAGIRGLFLNGLAGESLYTTYEEKMAMTKVAVAKANKKVPVVGNIAELRFVDAKKVLEGYVENGVDAICITQPSVLPYTADALYDYFSGLAALTNLPVYIYNAPQTSNTMAPGLVTRLVNNNENIVGYKDSTSDIVHLQNVMAGIKEGKHFECVAGSDATIFPTLAVGGCGIVSLISAVFPQPIIDVCDAWFAGNMEEAFKKQAIVLDLRTALKNAPFVAGYKYAASLIGLELGVVRNPLCDATDAQKAKLKENLTKLGYVK